MGKIDQHQINVFVNDGNGNPIAGAEIRAFDGEEEVGRAKMGSTSNTPGRFIFSQEYEAVRLEVTVPGQKPQSEKVGVDAGNCTFTFEDFVSKEMKPAQPSTPSGKGANKGMHTGLLTALGKIAGLGGVSVGIFFLLVQNILKQGLIAKESISGDQAYHVIVALITLIFGIAAIGVVAWIIGTFADKTKPVSHTALFILAVLVLAVLASSTVVLADFSWHHDGGSTKPEPPKLQTESKKEDDHLTKAVPMPTQHSPRAPRASVRKTGDIYIDNVLEKISKGEKDPNWSEGLRASAMEGLFERGAFSCASTESWPEMFWAVSATGIVLHNNIPAFQQHPRTKDSLNKAAGILMKMENDIAPLWGDSFDPTAAMSSYMGNHEEFIRHLPGMVNTPDDALQVKRKQNVNALRKALKGYIPVANDDLCQ